MALCGFPSGQSPGAGLNRRPRPYQGRALPTELPGHISRLLLSDGLISVIETSAILAAGHMRIGAGNGTRTRDPELGRLALYQLSYSRQKMVEREGFEPSKASPADLQSAPFGHSGTSPCFPSPHFISDSVRNPASDSGPAPRTLLAGAGDRI